MNRPNGPQNLPLLQLIRWITRPLDFMEDCARKYGDCFTLKLGHYPTFVFLSNPNAIAQVFAANPQLFEVGRSNSILRPTVGDNSVLLLDGERHQRQRQLLMPPFHGERMKAYGETICQITESMTQTWTAETSFTARSVMQAISMQVILQAVFGLYQGDRSQQIKQLLDELVEFSTSRVGNLLAFFPIFQRDFGPWSPWRRFEQLKAQIDQLLYAEIGDRQSQTERQGEDILSLLLSARDEAGEPMSEVELRDELITLLLAGHDTTATAMAWALYWIHRLPEVKQKLLAEIDGLQGNLEPNAIAKLPYLNAVCAETLRIYPVALIAAPRIPKLPFQVLDYEFAPGTLLAPCIYLTHRREDLYPEPEKFKPERFLERQFSPYEYFPFGGSNRRCIGAAFALFEMKLVLATILSRFDLALAEDRPVVPIRRGVTMAPKGGVNMRVKSQRVKVRSPISV